MRGKTIGIVLTLLLAGGVGWYLFRPELLFLDATVQEAFPEEGRNPENVRARGSFHGAAHEGKGTATIYRLADGTEVLRLSDFETSNGPALYVYLIAAEDAADSASVQGLPFVDLGPLKGNVGEQNYRLPAGVDLTRYRAVTIWCRRFGVNFTTAPLKPA